MSENIKDEISPAAAAAILWNQGIIHWMLHAGQKDLYDSYVNCQDKTVVWNCSRRFGKSFTLCVIAIETCIKRPNALIKYCCAKQVEARGIIRPLIREIITSCPKEMKPVFKTQERAWVFPNGSRIELSGLDGGKAESLRGGSCLEEGTLIMTPNGNVPIERLRAGDVVYGFNKDGTVSETKVLALHDNGVQEVTELLHGNKKLLSCTDNHKWLTRSRSNCQIPGRDIIFHEKQFADISERNDRIVRQFINTPCGTVNEPDAYAIGAFIGDGCATFKKGTKLILASKDDAIPNKVGKILNCFVQDQGKYQYKLSTTNEPRKHSNEIQFNYYNEWIKGKYWYEKNFDWDIVNTWNRESCLNLLAGLIDTDGSVYHHVKDNNLEIQYHSESPKLIENIQKLILKLFQYNATICIDKREKYSHPMYKLRIRSSLFSKRILKELDNHLVRENKKYKTIYDTIPESEKEAHIKVVKGNKHKAKVYDISVDNDTHLYLTANGLVTHNCDLAIIDEAGLVSDLKYIVTSILLPTTLTTKGKILLASTPPKTSAHPFVDYVNIARIQENLVTKTIHDNPQIDKDELQKIIEENGGEDSNAFRREFLCEILLDEESAIVPEFTKELRSKIIREWDRAPFYDAYVGMDLGLKDLTVVLFAWWDFRSAKLIIEDEFIINGQRFNTQVLAEGIKQKEQKCFTDLITGEQRVPYLRVSDNNLIVINDLWQLHGLRFIATRKDDADAALNNMKIMLQNEKIIINPRCKTLITHLECGIWNKSKSSFDRSPDMGHFDAIDSLKYMVRNVQQQKNPYPAGFGVGPQQDMFTQHEKKNHPQYQQFAAITNLPSSKKTSNKFDWFKRR